MWIKKSIFCSSDLFVKDDSVSVSRSYSCIKENSLISEGFSFSFSDFGILGDFGDFEYFVLNFLVIFGDSDLEVEGEFLGIVGKIFYFTCWGIFATAAWFNKILNYLNT